jgi:hypothetical protein
MVYKEFRDGDFRTSYVYPDTFDYENDSDGEHDGEEEGQDQDNA